MEKFTKVRCRWSLPLVVSLLSLVAWGCGATPPTPAPPAPPQIPVTLDVEERVVPPEAAEPAPVDVLVYYKNPEALVQSVAKLSKAQASEPAPPHDLFTWNARALVETVLGSEVAAMADLTQPVQFALLHGEGSDSRKSAYSLGLLTSTTKEPLDLEVGGQCVPHTGANDSARIVCSEAGPVTKSVLALFDRAANRAFGGDVLLELPKEAIERFSSEAEPEAAPQTPAAAFGRKLAKEFVGALGSVAFELTLGDAYWELAVELEVGQTSGFLTTLLVGDAPTALPPEFAGLPADANLGMTLSGLEPNVMLEAAEPAWREFEADLARYQPKTQVAAVVAELRQLVLTGGPLLIASGPPGPAQARLAQQSKDFLTRRLALQGWWSVGVHEPLERWAHGLEKLIELDQKPFPLAAGEPPKEASTPRPTRTILRKYPVPANSGLPKGSLHFRIWNPRNPDYVPGEGEPAPVETTTYVYVTGKPPITWIVGSEHDRLALVKARELLLAREGNPRARFFRPASAPSARALGFTTLKPLAMRLLPPEIVTGTRGNVPDGFGSWMETAEFPLRYSVTPRGASQFARFSVGVPREAINDLVSFALPLTMMFFIALPSPPTPP